jgi:hypothetical protein
MQNQSELLRVINQIFEIEKKVGQQVNIARNIERIKEAFGDMELQIHNPQGEKYNETRTDCEANIAGSSMKNLSVTNVIKPIIHFQGKIIQKGVVIVEGE